MTKSAAEDTYRKIEAEAPRRASPEVRRLDKHAEGAVGRQGDIYIHAVGEKHPRGRKITNRQLAPGVTTGSRHVATGAVEIFEGTTLPPWVRVPPGASVGAMLGPLVRVKKRATVTHPEHAHASLPPGDYQITYQIDERTKQRVQD